MSKVKFIGASWCPNCKPTKQKLETLGVSFWYIDADTDLGEKVCSENNVRSLPSVVLEDGTLLSGATKILEHFSKGAE